MRARFIVERCENGSSLGSERNDVTWTVVDKWHNRSCVLDTDRREVARQTAREYNAINLFAVSLARFCFGRSHEQR